MGALAGGVGSTLVELGFSWAAAREEEQFSVGLRMVPRV
jgi:hypothetical protein